MTIYTYKRGSNQYEKTRKTDTFRPVIGLVLGLTVLGALVLPTPDNKTTKFLQSIEFKTQPALVVAAEPTIKGLGQDIQKPATVPNIVAYIAEKWEKHGTGEVVKAINCFYSESGLRPNAVGQNSDGPKSKDHGVAQLNDYWHKLTDVQKTNYIANIDKAYEIYKGRGNSWSAWYGKLCN